MKLVLHLVRTDLRRLAAWLLLWAVVLIGMDVLGFAVLASHPIFASYPFSPWRDYELVRNVLVFAEAVIAFVFVVLLVQGDRVSGTRAFWMTRPIAGRTLLLAKCIAAFVILLVIPSVVTLPWWLWCGFGVHEIGIGVKAFAVDALAVAVPAAFVASLMDSLSRSLLWGLMVGAIAVVLFVMTLLAAGHTAGDLPIVRVPFRTVGVFATFAAVTFAQYVWRRAQVTGVVFGFGVVVCAVGWKPYVGYLAPFVTSHAAAGASVEVKLLGAEAVSEAGGAAQVITGFEVTGYPAGTLVAGTGIAQTWRESDRGRRIGAFSVLSSNRLIADIPYVTGFHRSAGRITPPPQPQVQPRFHVRRAPSLPPTGDPPDLVARAILRSADAAVVTGRPVRYDAELGMVLVQPRIVAERPLGDSGWHADSGRGLRIVGAQRNPDGVGCGVITTSVDPSWAPYASGQDPEHRFLCAVIDRAADLLSPETGVRQVAALTVNSVMISCRSFDGGPFPAGDLLTIAPIALIEKARIVRRVESDDFQVRDDRR